MQFFDLCNNNGYIDCMLFSEGTPRLQSHIKKNAIHAELAPVLAPIKWTENPLIKKYVFSAKKNGENFRRFW